MSDRFAAHPQGAPWGWATRSTGEFSNGTSGENYSGINNRVGQGSERIRFSSAILPPYARRSKSLEVLIPILYLKGVSTGDFEEALITLLGKDAGGLSATTGP